MTRTWNAASRWALALLVWSLCALYLHSFAFRGWIPHDEGALAHAAERVLQGEWPHRDFDDPYTGGLAFLHAWAFRSFGTRLDTIRVVLLVAAMLWIPALYWIAARRASPPTAAAVVLLCVAWSLPNYFAALPSWYNLFFATWGTAALLRNGDTGRRRWLAVAGLCGGFSVLIKITGVYYVAAALLYLVYRDAARSPATNIRAPLLSIGKTLVLTAFSFLFALLVRHRLGLMELILYVLPGTALCGLLIWQEWRPGRGVMPDGFRRVGGQIALFGISVALPVIAFLIPYVLGGGLHDLYEGVLVVPARRLSQAVYSLPPPRSLLAIVPLAAALLVPGTKRVGGRAVLTLVTVAALSAVLILAHRDSVYQWIWHSTRPLVALVAVGSCAVIAPRLIRNGVHADRSRDHEDLFLLCSMAVTISLVQYPYAFAIYFCYVAPFVVLALLYLVQQRPRQSRWLPGVFLAFYLAFAVIWLNTGYIRHIGIRHTRIPQTEPLADRGGGIAVDRDSWAVYTHLVGEVQRRTPPGSWIYAGPDCPEIYFLTGTRNPTRSLYAFLSAPIDDPQRFVDMLNGHNVRVVVLNQEPEFSQLLSAQLRSALDSRFPNKVRLAWFQVQWRP